MQKMLGNDPRVRGETAQEWAEGSLNPGFVEWLMGYPDGYTVAEGDPDRTLESDPWSEGERDGVPRVAKGVKDRVNRLKCLGNSIVPQIVSEVLAPAIKEFEG